MAAGFKVRPATIPEQRSHINTLPDDRFTTVKENGNPYYLYADKKNGKLFVRNRFAYQAYINNVKNNELHKQGAFVWEMNPADRALNRTIVVWHGWGHLKNGDLPIVSLCSPPAANCTFNEERIRKFCFVAQNDTARPQFAQATLNKLYAAHLLYRGISRQSVVANG